MIYLDAVSLNKRWGIVTTHYFAIRYYGYDMDLVLPEKRICEGRRPEAYPFFRIFSPFPKLFREGGIKGGWVSNYGV